MSMEIINTMHHEYYGGIAVLPNPYFIIANYIRTAKHNYVLIITNPNKKYHWAEVLKYYNVQNNTKTVVINYLQDIRENYYNVIIVDYAESLVNLKYLSLLHSKLFWFVIRSPRAVIPTYKINKIILQNNTEVRIIPKIIPKFILTNVKCIELESTYTADERYFLKLMVKLCPDNQLMHLYLLRSHFFPLYTVLEYCFHYYSERTYTVLHYYLTGLIINDLYKHECENFIPFDTLTTIPTRVAIISSIYLTYLQTAGSPRFCVLVYTKQIKTLLQRYLTCRIKIVDDVIVGPFNYDTVIFAEKDRGRSFSEVKWLFLNKQKSLTIYYFKSTSAERYWL
ncbi:hypothetical LCDV1 paralog family 2 [Lymphocystis disease virus 1]|uniref:hypothetical LCDV1 paralog family 2 n=1 Tax=Fish lymphocystis disease virus TaxID=36363 RepID=UPI0000161EBD|nr:hypothetical LCDV1 paralog family 2 [Lymphocystis disease virus 1]